MTVTLTPIANNYFIACKTERLSSINRLTLLFQATIYSLLTFVTFYQWNAVRVLSNYTWKSLFQGKKFEYGKIRHSFPKTNRIYQGSIPPHSKKMIIDKLKKIPYCSFDKSIASRMPDAIFFTVIKFLDSSDRKAVFQTCNDWYHQHKKISKLEILPIQKLLKKVNEDVIQEHIFIDQHLRNATLHSKKRLKMVHEKVYNLFIMHYEALKNNASVVILACKYDPEAFTHASEQIKNDTKTLRKLAKNYKFRKWGFKNLKSNKAFALAIVSKKATNLFKFNADVRDDFDVIKASISANLFTICFASERLRLDRKMTEIAIDLGLDYPCLFPLCETDSELALKFLQKNPGRLGLLSETLQNNYDFVKKAVRLSHYNIRYASKRLQFNIDIVKEVINNDPFPYFYIDDWKNNKEIGLLILEKRPDIFKEFSNELKDDFDIAKRAITLNSLNFRFTSERLRGNSELQQIALEHNLINLFQNFHLVKKKEIALQIVSQLGWCLEKLPQKFKNDFQVVKAAISKPGSGNNLDHASKRLKKNRKLVVLAHKNRMYKKRQANFSLP